MAHDIDFSKAASADYVLTPEQRKDPAHVTTRQLELRYLDLEKEVRLHYAKKFPYQTNTSSDTKRPQPAEPRTSLSELKKLYRLVRSDWIHSFVKIGKEENIPEFGPVSLSDRIFRAVCRMSLLLDKNITERPSKNVRIEAIARCHAEVTIVSACHTLRSRRFWPDALRVDQMCTEIAQTVVAFFDVTQASLANLARIVGSDRVNFIEMLSKTPYDRLLLADYVLCHLPADVKRDLDEQIAALEAKKSRRQRRSLLYDDPADADGIKEESEEVMGYMWRTSAQELIRQFVPRMSRFVWKVKADRDLLKQYPTPAGFCFPKFKKESKKRIFKWLAKRCANEQDDETLAAFRRNTAEFSLPIAYETTNCRDRRMSSAVMDTVSMASAQLGVRLSGFLAKSTMVPMNEILKQQYTVHREPILLTHVDAYLQQEQHFKWSEKYFCTRPHDPEWTARFAAKHYKGKPPRPIIAKNIQKHFWVFYRQAFYPCGPDFHQAKQFWLYIMKRDFSTTYNRKLQLKLEDDEDVAALYLEFLPEIEAEVIGSSSDEEDEYDDDSDEEEDWASEPSVAPVSEAAATAAAVVEQGLSTMDIDASDDNEDEDEDEEESKSQAD